MKESTYEIFRFEWREFEIDLRYCPDWSSGHSHIEIRSVCHSPLPITETGYRSHFTMASIIEEWGGPVSFAEAWLDHEADKAGWKRDEEKRKQFSLF